MAASVKRDHAAGCLDGVVMGVGCAVAVSVGLTDPSIWALDAAAITAAPTPV